MMVRIQLLWGAALLAALSLWTGTAEAQRRRGPRVDAAAIRAHLDAAEPSEIRSAIEQIGVSGSAQLVEPLAQRIRRGLPPELLELAVETLGVLGRAEAGPILFELVSHRRAAVRLKTVDAIVACEPRGASRALVAALDDSSGPVRSAAALGLGQLGDHEVIDSLFLAMDRGVMEASTAVGQIARPAHVTRLLAYLTRAPFDALTPAFMELLAREDLSDASKLEVIARLAELATAEVKGFLEDLVSALPEDRRNQRVRQAAEEAAARIVG